MCEVWDEHLYYERSYDNMSVKVISVSKDGSRAELRAHNFCYGQGCTSLREHGSAYCKSCARKIVANLGVLAGLGPVPAQLEFSDPKTPSLREQK